MSDTDIINLGKIFAESGYFQDARDAAKAIVKIMAGRELDLAPIVSMTGIHIIKGKVTLSATIMATIIKKTDGYDYKITEHTNEICTIEFIRDELSIGISSFSLDDAKKAGLSQGDNYKKYPRNMLFSRAMSNGIKWHCPEVLGGSAYTPDEMENVIDSETTRELLRPDEVIIETVQEMAALPANVVQKEVRNKHQKNLTIEEIEEIQKEDY